MSEKTISRYCPFNPTHIKSNNRDTTTSTTKRSFPHLFPGHASWHVSVQYMPQWKAQDKCSTMCEVWWEAWRDLLELSILTSHNLSVFATKNRIFEQIFHIFAQICCVSLHCHNVHKLVWLLWEPMIKYCKIWINILKLNWLLLVVAFWNGFIHN